MTSQDRAITTYQEQPPHELTLPDSSYLRRELGAVREFQRLAHELLIKDSDYGVIPGTDKPTLLKPGAEKIIKLLGLADTYEIIDKVEDWDRPLFRYVVRCRLLSVRTGNVVAEGLGECNTYESRYRWRWAFESQLPRGVDKSTLATRSIRTRNGPATQYRLENEDVFSIINTVMKMAAKRALVAAALSAGRLSEVFTQDMDDIAPTINHDDDDHEPAPRQQARPQARVVEATARPAEETAVRPGTRIKELLGKLGWSEERAVKHVQETYHVKDASELTRANAYDFIDYLTLEVIRVQQGNHETAPQMNLGDEAGTAPAPSSPSAGARALMEA